MKIRTLAVVAIGFVLRASGVGAPTAGYMMLDTPMDNERARQALSKELGNVQWPAKMEYKDIRRRFLTFNRHDIEKMFGLKLVRIPTDRALPLFAPLGILLPDGYSDPDPRLSANKWDLHRVGNMGYIEVYYKPDKWGVAGIVFYNRTDKQFVPYRTREDLDARWRWDYERFVVMRSWLAEQLFQRFGNTRPPFVLEPDRD
jgi:hypothetical protein